MFYEFTLTIPASTSVLTPASLQAKLVKGVINRVEVQFWAGQRGNVHVRIREKEHQLWPSNLEEWFTGENHVIAFDEDYELVDPPYVLDIEGYNEDTDYEHQVIVRFLVSVGRWTIEDLVKLLYGPVEVVS